MVTRCFTITWMLLLQYDPLRNVSPDNNRGTQKRPWAKVGKGHGNSVTNASSVTIHLHSPPALFQSLCSEPAEVMTQLTALTSLGRVLPLGRSFGWTVAISASALAKMPPTFSSKYLAAPASIPHLFSCLTLGRVASQENIMQNFVNINIYICVYIYMYISVYIRDSEGGIQKFADTTLNLLDLVLNIFVFAPKKNLTPTSHHLQLWIWRLVTGCADTAVARWERSRQTAASDAGNCVVSAWRDANSWTNGVKHQGLLYGDTTCEGYDTCLTARGLELQVSQSLCPASQLGDLVKYLKSGNMDKANKGENHSGFSVVFLGAFGAGYHLKV